MVLYPCQYLFVISGDVGGAGAVLKVVSQGKDHGDICLFGNKLKSLEVRNRKLTPIKETLQSYQADEIPGKIE